MKGDYLSKLGLMNMLTGEYGVLDFFHARRVSLSHSVLITQSARYPGFTRTEIRFATCVETKRKRYYINLDDIIPVDESKNKLNSYIPKLIYKSLVVHYL